jgi:hypothetical protein
MVCAHLLGSWSTVCILEDLLQEIYRFACFNIVA